MIEACVAWFCLFIGVISCNPLWYIASGAFATACQIWRLVDKKEGKKDGN